ncbi:ABC-F family ATP-binding cassette domain-containing protein [Hufsiella ginkgonis]|uniref:ATP-binding cassette domain-containing protein n=1 Tax=Hufsiella ginkgonis TaxID=2695274 RepID=A0A7K1XW11_9SPHI|nr:ABC-F family ATP-binding cassette domain-containing protein [Hufsiella ginkgonis]MXV14716.1 ATP-binding cassette domain-containing protein [Hufsiella ginkgonis]
MSSILSTEQLGHSFNDTWLFKDLTLGLAKGQRFALVGYNGAGKSTLLKILAGKLAPVLGKVVQERDIKIGYLEQDPDFAGQKTVGDFIYSADNTQQLLIRRYEELLEQEHPDEDLLQELTTEISEQNAWEYEHAIKTILDRLSINKPDQLIGSLSGGQRKRLALAKLLIDDPDVFILDEPTNHLDIEMIEWLESFLTTGKKTILMVTHDRYFLDNVCTQIYELEFGKLYVYRGNYSYFLEKKAEREAENATALQKNTNLLKKELEWMRRQPQARGTKSKSRIDAFYELEDKTKNQNNKSRVELSITVARQGNKILELEHVNKAFNGVTIINDFNYVFKKGDRIGIAGRNGSGKSTLLNLITGKFSPDTGQIIKGETTIYGYYSQGGLSFKENERVLDIVKNVAEYIPMADGKTISASQLLTHFLFPPSKQYGMVSKLSGGEKKRLHLMRVLMTNPNFLILDEPTNDLDIDTLNVLEEFLEKFTGVLLVVSHDRYLMDKLSDQLFIFEGAGHIRIYSGNYSEYRYEKENIKTDAKPKEIQVKTAPLPVKNKLSYKEQKELDTLDEQIGKHEAMIASLNDRMLMLTDANELIAAANEVSALKEKLEEMTIRWMELSE